MWKKIIDKEMIVLNPQVTNKKELFEGMVNHVYNHDCILNRNNFLSSLCEREEMSNTELADGVAFPHARSETVEKLFLSIIILKNGIDYENEQFGPVKIIFFFGCPEAQAKEYLQLLAKSSRLLKNQEFKQKLLNCENPDQVVELLIEYSDDDQGEKDSNNYLLFMTINDPNKQSEILSAMIEVGINNASLIEATSLAKKLSYEMPIFAGLSYMAQGKSKKADLVFGFLDNKDQAGKLAKLLKENGINLDDKGVGFIQLIKIENVIGNTEVEIEI